jgi:HSP20 family molecular chaperone IbpA
VELIVSCLILGLRSQGPLLHSLVLSLNLQGKMAMAYHYAPLDKLDCHQLAGPLSPSVWPWAWKIERSCGPADFQYCPNERYAQMHLRPFRRHASLAALRGFSEVQLTDQAFNVRLDVEHFSPDELAVHFNSNNELIIEAEHDEKPDEHGVVSRHFKRIYYVPSDIIEDDMVCSISTGGILTVHVPRVQPKLQLKKIPILEEKKKIPIVETGKPHKFEHVGFGTYLTSHCCCGKSPSDD